MSNEKAANGLESFNYGLVKIVYPVIAGVWLTLCAVVFSACWCITLVGIPFAYAWIRFAYLAAWPFDKAVVKKDRISGLATTGNVLWLIANWFPLVVLFLLFWASMLFTPGDRQLDKVFAFGFLPFGKKIESA